MPEQTTQHGAGTKQLRAVIDSYNAGENFYDSGFGDSVFLGYISHLEVLQDRLNRIIPAEQMPTVAAHLTVAEWLAENQSQIAENSKAIITMSRRI